MTLSHVNKVGRMVYMVCALGAMFNAMWYEVHTRQTTRDHDPRRTDQCNLK